jgi:uncharacterized protein YdeI (YjbR/CyaY-like superfamily)
MPQPIETLEVRNRQHWRTWLRVNHTKSPGIWLIFYKKHTGRTSVPYEDAVREALCFGWIDSLIRRLDDDRFALKITPRKPTSKWSDSNRKRWAELKEAGLLAKAGEAAAPTSRRYAPLPKVPALPAYIAAALKPNKKAWRHFQQLSAGDRRQYVAWIHTAKRPQTRKRRLEESVELLMARRKLGLK